MYSRALQIIQTEEYLDEADLDEIRREDDDYDPYLHGYGNHLSYIKTECVTQRP